MKTLRLLMLPALLALSACGDDGPKSPMSGNWTEVTAEGKPAMTLTFDGYSDKLNVHGRPREDGTHGHEHGTYTFDEQSKAVTVRCKLFDGDKASNWAGNVDGDKLSLAAGEQKLEFTRGGKPHGH